MKLQSDIAGWLQVWLKVVIKTPSVICIHLSLQGSGGAACLHGQEAGTGHQSIIGQNRKHKDPRLGEIKSKSNIIYS